MTTLTPADLTPTKLAAERIIAPRSAVPPRPLAQPRAALSERMALPRGDGLVRYADGEPPRSL